MRDIATKIENNGATADGRHSADEFNGVYRDTRDSVIRAGLTLDNADQTQTSQSSWIHGNASSVFIASGSANAIIAVPSRGVTGPRLPPSLTNMDGAIIDINITTQNTGAATLNVGQTTSSLLGLRKILTLSGDELSSGHLLGFSRFMYSLSADSGNGAWLLVSGMGNNEAGDQINLPYTPSSSEMTRRRILHRDGSSVLRTDFPLLFAKIGTTYGSVDVTHFNLPDDRGLFERLMDDGAGVDEDAATRTDRGDGTTGDNVGTKQASSNLEHTHGTNVARSLGGPNSSMPLVNNGNNVTPFTADGSSTLYSVMAGGNVNDSGGTESRPKNIYKWGGIFY